MQVSSISACPFYDIDIQTLVSIGLHTQESLHCVAESSIEVIIELFP